MTRLDRRGRRQGIGGVEGLHQISHAIAVACPQMSPDPPNLSPPLIGTTTDSQGSLWEVLKFV